MSAALLTLASALSVWPTPKSISLQETGRLHLGNTFSFEKAAKAVGSAKFERAGKRYDDAVSKVLGSLSGNETASIKFDIGKDETVNKHTKYDYNITIGSDSVSIGASTIYGGMYALETISQLLYENHGSLPYGTIVDQPAYSRRGLMIDTGRRFFPLSTVENLLDTMAGVKMNVLHLHASDYCRWSVESKIYPNLTNALTGDMGGYYTQEDIKSMISYASERGIRVVPEFDVPGHSRGMLPIISEGLQFCTEGTTQTQLFGDPQNKTLNIIKKLFTEMSSLFTDDEFNIGADETAAKGVCTVQSTFNLEREVLNFVANDLKKTPVGWEEILFDAGAATNSTIVDAWSRHNPGQITATGRRAIDSSSAHFYFTEAAPGGPTGWSKCWYNISETVPAGQEHLLLGGEVSMWTDTYCNVRECITGPPQVGSPLFPPSADAAFEESVGGMIWPRGFVAAAAFWNYNSSVNPSSTEFTNNIWSLTSQLAARGSKVCPVHCSCNQLTACGKPYLNSTL
eukprot:TRINITY_DN41_c1_g1_i1.p1 TRINITY_DN41_c1_g1~~TRINITY_DN41_c1_g1_i1.p1  ORF type:complete len:526 (+),score=126.26 TRINITY_DN41_c1_g1_i1:40-1578(+)